MEREEAAKVEAIKLVDDMHVIHMNIHNLLRYRSRDDDGNGDCLETVLLTHR